MIYTVMIRLMLKRLVKSQTLPCENTGWFVVAIALSRLCLNESDRYFIFKLKFVSLGKSCFLPNPESLYI
jgi:hypothetical protein